MLKSTSGKADKVKCSEGGFCDYSYEYSTPQGDWFSCTKCGKKIRK